MKIAEVRDLIKLKPVPLDAVHRRLSACHDVADLRRTARRLTPRPVFDYVDGGADEEISMAANMAAFRSWRFTPRALADVSSVCTSATVLGRELPLPLVLGPTGYTRMMHPAGEIAVARSAQRHGLPYALSTMATTTIEDVAAAARPDLWFQLYVLRQASLRDELVDRAEAAGYRVLMITTDTVVTGHRVRDERNGLVIPPAITASTLAGIAIHPGYWVRMLRSPAIEFANFPKEAADTIAQTGSMFDKSLSWDTVAALRTRWSGKLILKGPFGPQDARRAVELGADGMVLSNHGGRQLDRAVAPIDLLPAVRAAVGPDVQLIVDSGVRKGADIAVALALGADAAAIGRAYLYGLMAGGEAGVDRALSFLTAELIRTMQLLGVRSVAELREHGTNLLAPRVAR
jgi:L-lactate dehydrogenase (cytochrome)